jgi:K+-sensing histidine kinase KdpD
MLGYPSPGDLPGKFLGKHLFYEEPDRIKKFFAGVVKTGFSSMDVCSAMMDSGNDFLVEVSSSVIHNKNEDVVRFLIILKDITEKVLLEKEMEYYHQEMKIQAETLARANRKLNLLSSITRHDILNQLTALSGYLELVLEENLDETVRLYLLNCQHASLFIQEQISFTKEYEEIGVNAPVWQNISDIIQKLKKTEALSHFTYHVSVQGLAVYADPLLEKVFYTFLENSIRHGIKTTDVWFSYERSDDQMILVYADNGEGVANENKEKIFLKAFGKHTGFWLFVTQEILAITGMTIKETGVPGAGARFEISIPPGMYQFV